MIRATISRMIVLDVEASGTDVHKHSIVSLGALDLSKPGNLLKFVPKKPPAVVEAEGDRVVVDLLKVPKLAKNPVLRRLLGVLSPVVGIRAIETDRDHLYVKLRASPAGLPEAIGAIRTMRRS